MNTHPIDESGTRTDPVGQRTAALRRMTAEQLLHLGTRQMVYLRSGMCDGEPAYMLYGADGAPFVVVDAIETAVDLATERGLEIFAVH